MGRSIFWFTIIPLEGAAKGTDRWAIEHNWVSITPLRLDLTDEADLARALAVSATPAMKVAAKRGRTIHSRKKRQA
jgi:5'-nucleotidase